MRLTLSVIKADIGSVGGHTKPSTRMMAAVQGEVAKAICDGLLIDAFVCHTGDDIAIIMTHTRGEGSSEVHQLAWKAFLAATSVANSTLTSAREGCERLLQYALDGGGEDNITVLIGRSVPQEDTHS